MSAAASDSFAGAVALSIETGLKLKKIMLKRGLRRCRCVCPRCGGMIHAGLAGRRDHLRMSCSGCGLNMME